MSFEKELLMGGSRLQILIDGKQRWGMSLEKAPDNEEEWIEILEEMLRMLKAPNIEDNETF
jgi:hypothetical protein